MATQSEVQELLRFLSRDAKVPLNVAMAKVKELQQNSLSSIGQLAKSNLKDIKDIFTDEKLAKQVLNAAKRVSKKRSSGTSATPKARHRKTSDDGLSTPAAIEASLSLPISTESDDILSKMVLQTNRAPLLLAFAFTLLKYTMPSQPLSSRLSLAKAVMSMNSRTKAINLGIERGNSA
ncbi:hypothetical protein MMC14_006991 [Varicellaria rhodocarpa]|nr:hypothetical protein [Varicellaria rhodocarpa]